MSFPGWVLNAFTIVGGIAAIIGLWERIRKRSRRRLTKSPTTSLTKPALWKRWAVATSLALVAALSASLGIGRASSADVDLEMSVSGVSFELSNEAPMVAEPVRLLELGASGLAEIETPFRWLAASGNPIGVLEASTILLSADAASASSVLYLDDVVLPGGTSVTIQALELPGEFRFALSGVRVEPSISVGGLITVVVPGVIEGQTEFAPGKFRSISESDWIALDLVLLDDTSVSFSPNLPTEALRFQQVDKYRQGAIPKDHLVSSVLAGSVSFPRLKRRLALAEGDGLWLSSSEGDTDLALTGNQIEVSFAGAVSGMATGRPESRNSLMPRRAEVWLVQYALLTVPAALLYLVGLYACARWWRGSL